MIPVTGKSATACKSSENLGSYRATPKVLGGGRWVRSLRVNFLFSTRKRTMQTGNKHRLLASLTKGGKQMNQYHERHKTQSMKLSRTLGGPAPRIASNIPPASRGRKVRNGLKPLLFSPDTTPASYSSAVDPCHQQLKTLKKNTLKYFTLLPDSHNHSNSL